MKKQNKNSKNTREIVKSSLKISHNTISYDNKRDKQEEITKNSLIIDVVSKHLETIGVFQEHGMGCFGCAMARMETIEQGALAHGIDVDKLVRDLNMAVNKNIILQNSS